MGGVLCQLETKKGTLFNIENFPKTFLQAEQKNPKETGKKNAKIKSPPNLCLLANFVTSPLEIHTVAAPPPPKKHHAAPFGLPAHLLLFDTVPGTSQPMAASLGCPAFLGV